MTKKRSEPLASSVGSPALSGTSSSELTGRPSCVTPAPARASKRTFWPLTTKLPAVSASEGLSSTSALPAPRPKVLSPGFSQNRPASVSQPSSPVSASRRWVRQAWTLARSACSASAVGAPAAGGVLASAGASRAQARAAASGRVR